MTTQTEPTIHIIHSLEQRLFDTEHELALLMNHQDLQASCCQPAEDSNGWNHHPSCPHGQMPF